MENSPENDDPVIDDLLKTSSRIYANGFKAARALFKSKGNAIMATAENRVRLIIPNLSEDDICRQAFKDMNDPLAVIADEMREAIDHLRLEHDNRKSALYLFGMKRGQETN